MTNNPGFRVTRTVLAAAAMEATAEGTWVLVAEGSLQAPKKVAPITTRSGAHRIRPIFT
ncbi:MAG TPA: hypothetical protein VGZ22_18460 [Isosphaeraceae bacterium]|nr:hypothetical protein [Isosphaeraceae bacterium]